MDQEYQLTTFRRMGEPYQSKAGQLQSFWVTLIDSVGKPVEAKWDKMVSGGDPSIGPVSGHIEVVPKKDGSGTYLKFKKGAGAGYTSQVQLPHTQGLLSPVQAPPTAVAPERSQSTISWGEAVIAAAMHTANTEATSVVLDEARLFYQSSPTSTAQSVQAAKAWLGEEQPPIELYEEMTQETQEVLDDEVNLDDIPF